MKKNNIMKMIDMDLKKKNLIVKIIFRQKLSSDIGSKLTFLLISLNLLIINSLSR